MKGNHGSRLTLMLTCVVFFALGLFTAALGPLLEEIAGRTGISLAGAGSLYSALFAGALIAQLISGPLSDRIGQRPLFTWACLVLAIGFLGIAFSFRPNLVVLCALVAGLGHGAVNLCGNTLIGRMFSGHAVRLLNLINLFYAIGAVSGPALGGFALSILQTGMPVFWLGGVLLLFSFFGLLITKRRESIPGNSPSQMNPKRLVLRTPLLWLIGMLMLLYVGVEISVGGWAALYLTRTTAIGQGMSALVTAGYWLALAGGRMLGMGFGNLISPGRLVGWSLGFALSGAMLLLTFRGQPALTVAGIWMLGSGFGVVYPTVFAILMAEFARTPGLAASLVTSLCSVGGMLLPWFSGLLIEEVGPASLPAVAVFSILGMLQLLTLILRRRTAGRQFIDSPSLTGEPSI